MAEASECIQKRVPATEGEAMKALARIIAGVLRIRSLPAVWSARVGMREQLGAMPERLLTDIGLDHAAVAREIRKPFWRPLGECVETGAPMFHLTALVGSPVPMPALLQPVARLSGATFPILS
jgi:uncharacterized protein YjiS (DUF1127 family)